MNSSQSTVDLIFSKCSLLYGRDFLGRWEGQEIDEVKADWIRELGGLIENKKAIVYGLNNLPEKAPTVRQFRDACLHMPVEPIQTHLTDVALRVVAPKVLAALKTRSEHEPKAWAYRLQEREARGEKLTAYQKSCWRAALTAVDEKTVMGAFTPPSVEVLPPAMQEYA